MSSKKYNKTVEEEVIITPNDYEHQVIGKLMILLQSLQEEDLPTYIQNKISNNSFDQKTKEKAERPVELFQKLLDQNVCPNNGSDDSKSKDGKSQEEDYF